MKSTVLLPIWWTVLNTVHSQECRLLVSEAPTFPALLVRSGETPLRLLYPDIVSQPDIRAYDIPEGETLTAACTGEENYLTSTKIVTANVTCSKGRLKVNNKNAAWEDLLCTKEPTSTVKSKGKCVALDDLYQIGWQISKEDFVPQLDVCFDKDHETTLYTYHQVHGRYIDARIKNNRPDWSPVLFNSDVDKLYKLEKQIFEQALGYLPDSFNKRSFLDRGHLAPKADFVLPPEQNATFYYINAVPQWAGFNGKNWVTLETAIRDLAERLEADLDIWTGSHGVLKLPDVNGNPVEMYLDYPNPRIPVPSMIWKAIYNQAAGEAVIIIGLNVIEEASLNHWPCPDVCPELSWVSWDVENMSTGQMFCCSVEAVRKIIPIIPDLGRVSLLA